MSLTGSDHLYVAVTERGAQKLLKAVYTARPRLLRYNSSISSNTLTETDAAPLFGFVNWTADLNSPRIDFFPANAPVPAPLGPLLVDWFTIRTLASTQFQSPWPPPMTPDLFAVGQMNVSTSGGTTYLSFQVNQMMDLNPSPPLSPAIWTGLALTYLNPMLPPPISVTALAVGVFTAVLTRGPTIDRNELKFWGHL